MYFKLTSINQVMAAFLKSSKIRQNFKYPIFVWIQEQFQQVIDANCMFVCPAVINNLDNICWHLHVSLFLPIVSDRELKCVSLVADIKHYWRDQVIVFRCLQMAILTCFNI